MSIDPVSLAIMGGSAAAAAVTTWIADAVVRKAFPRTRPPAVRTLVPLAFPLGVAALGIASSMVDASRHPHEDWASLDLLTTLAIALPSLSVTIPVHVALLRRGRKPA